MLSDAQRAHFETFGFLIVRQMFTPAETARISQDFDRVLEAGREGGAFSGEKRQIVLGFVEKNPGLTRLLEDDRLFGAIERLLGPGFTWLGSDGNLYVGDTAWHPDGSEPDFVRIKAAFYLDPVTRDTGALRVVPGSHRQPFHEALRPLATYRDHPIPPPFGVAPDAVPHVALESQPGDVAIFNHNIWHASFGGRVGRRMFALNFAEDPAKESHVAYMHRVYQNKINGLASQQGDGTVYGEAFLNSGRPRLKALTARLVAWGFK